jgi:cytochrome P450
VHPVGSEKLILMQSSVREHYLRKGLESLTKSDSVAGHTVPFFKSADKTLTYGRSDARSIKCSQLILNLSSEYFRNTREPYAIVVAGTTIYIITSANDAALVLKNVENLTFDEYIRDMMLRFGTSEAAVEAMWRHPSKDEAQNPKLIPNPMHKALSHLQESIMKWQLHPGAKLETLSEKFLGCISSAMTWEHMTTKVVRSESKDGKYRIVGLLEWTQEVLLESATRTFFGDRLLDMEPDLFKNFFTFDDNSWLFTYKIPKPWSKEMLAAKDVVQRALEKYFALPAEDRPGEAWVIRTLEDEMRGRGIASKDIAAMLNMIFWVINGNAYKLCFWILAYLMHDPALFSAIKEEVVSAIDAHTPASELPERLDKCKQLDSVYHEVMRLISSSMAVRNVATPMEVGGKTLSKGTKILVPFRQMHFNEDVWGANVREFDPTRFMTAEGKKGRDAARDSNFRPFGGGTTICPGRFLAKREVLAFVALGIVRFDLSLEAGTGEKDDNGVQSVFPKLELAKPCLGLMGPAKGDNVYIKVMPAKS